MIVVSVRELQSTVQLGLLDAVLGRQVFVPSQQLLVHRPRHLGQDARSIHNCSLPYPGSATASWAVRKIVPDHLRHRYAYPAWALGFRPFEFFDPTTTDGHQ